MVWDPSSHIPISQCPVLPLLPLPPGILEPWAASIQGLMRALTVPALCWVVQAGFPFLGWAVNYLAGVIQALMGSSTYEAAWGAFLTSSKAGMAYPTASWADCICPYLPVLGDSVPGPSKAEPIVDKSLGFLLGAHCGHNRGSFPGISFHSGLSTQPYWILFEPNW